MKQRPAAHNIAAAVRRRQLLSHDRHIEAILPDGEQQSMMFGLPTSVKAEIQRFKPPLPVGQCQTTGHMCRRSEAAMHFALGRKYFVDFKALHNLYTRSSTHHQSVTHPIRTPAAKAISRCAACGAARPVGDEVRCNGPCGRAPRLPVSCCAPDCCMLLACLLWRLGGSVPVKPAASRE